MNQQQKEITHYMLAIGASKEVSIFIAAQATLESGNFESNIYKDNNNFMGMKLAKCRITTAVGTNRNHAQYNTRLNCMQDYIIWLVYNGFTQNHLKDVELFKTRLANSNYCPKSDYINRINNIYNQIKETTNTETK